MQSKVQAAGWCPAHREDREDYPPDVVVRREEGAVIEDVDSEPNHDQQLQPASTKAFKEWALSGRYELEVAGRRLGATPHWDPLYDPAAMRMRDVEVEMEEPRAAVG